ncbi:hypothetical protein BKA62DRAFT_311825 [Auriculariales sp. MPI-PUGE-AT-0066]|nr:hypothetical protein BKA62DRAFT_311825 [Auriculariales sp. MPI-PUGE-AT-0066]
MPRRASSRLQQWNVDCLIASSYSMHTLASGLRTSSLAYCAVGGLLAQLEFVDVPPRACAPFSRLSVYVILPVSAPAAISFHLLAELAGPDPDTKSCHAPHFLDFAFCCSSFAQACLCACLHLALRLSPTYSPLHSYIPKLTASLTTPHSSPTLNDTSCLRRILSPNSSCTFNFTRNLPVTCIYVLHVSSHLRPGAVHES